MMRQIPDAFDECAQCGKWHYSHDANRPEVPYAFGACRVFIPKKSDAKVSDNEKR